MTTACRTEIHGRVTEVILDDPPRRNSLNRTGLQELAEAFLSVTRAAADGRVAAVLLRGEGGIFSSGLDLRDDSLWGTDASIRTNALRDVHRALANISVPTIAAVERYAVAGAAGLVFGCDYIVMGADAYIEVPEVRMGIAAPMNIGWLIFRHGLAVATEIVLSGEKVPAQRLLQLGAVRAVVPDGDVVKAASGFAHQLASFPPEGLTAIKAQLHAAAQDPARFLQGQLGSA